MLVLSYYWLHKIYVSHRRSLCNVHTNHPGDPTTEELTAMNKNVVGGTSFLIETESATC